MRKSLLTIIICLISSILLAGCGSASEDNPGSGPANAGREAEKTEDDNEDVQKPEKKNRKNKKDKQASKTDGQKSLAQRMAGKYSYHYSDEDGNDEFYIMNVVPFGDNLYAYCGQAMPEDYESLDAYTFWASEFIPYDADEMTSTDGDTVTVNELRFSVMSNAGKYWDAGHKGTITLTDDGLVFEGFDHEGFLVPENDDSRLFLKDERVEDVFSYLNNDKADAPEQLQGLWVYGDDNNSVYVEFSGSDMYVYRKDPGQEVSYMAGGCDFHDGSFEFAGNMLGNGGMPIEFSGGFNTDGNELTLDVEGTDAAGLLPEHEVYRRITDREIHVITMDEVELDSASFGSLGGNQYIGALKEQDYYGVIVLSAKSADKCMPTVEKLEAAGFVREPVVYTPDFSQLNPEPYYVATAGMFTSKEEAEKMLAKVKDAGFKDAYMKYAGSYTGDRYWYYMYDGATIDELKDGVMLRGVSVTIPYITYAESVTADLLVTDQTVFDKSAETEFFGNYENGDTPYEWIIRNKKLMNEDIDQYMQNGPALVGVFEVGLEDNKITTYYGSGWWD
ncbi:MAG: SPOR domain-containing protein [Lachnospiraceae bacterium]|nr:SPOR domain-containing protein [Lachnospiraceae bacterium]